MRGKNLDQPSFFYHANIEDRIPKKHPLRKIRALVDPILKNMSGKFDEIYSSLGRPSIPPENLLKAMLLQYLYGIRSERLLLEQIDYNLLYRWFLDLAPDKNVWDETVFTKNRDRLLAGEVADLFFTEVIALADKNKLLSDDHFTADGTLIEAWASLKSLKPKEEKAKDKNDDGDKGNPSVDFHGEKRTNETHESSTDPDSKIYTKSKGSAAKLSYMGHVLMENRNGLAVGATVNKAGYYAEHDAALEMLDDLPGNNKKTLGADKHYDDYDFCDELKGRNITPHIAANVHSHRFHTAIDGRTLASTSYKISQRKRKRVEEIFGWAKWGVLRRPHFRGLKKIAFVFKFAMASYNLLRISNIFEAQYA
jgi:transposase